MLDYNGTTALVTGAASGIGRALAVALSERGALVICADRNLQGAEETAMIIGNSAQAIECDLATSGAAEKLIEQSFALSGRLDLVCSNAGIGYNGSVFDEDMNDDADLSRLFEINFFAGIKIAQAYRHQLKRHDQRGRLMVTASENSLSVPEAVKRAKMAFYGATKHALLVAFEWMRLDSKSEPIDLHVLLPGAMYTPLIAKSLPDPAMAPPELELISAQQCAQIALKGLDNELFYIPTQAHLLDDMQPRSDAIKHALEILQIDKTY